MNAPKTWREGSVRYYCMVRKEWVTAEPGSMWFSTVTMAAEEVFLDGVWQSIWPDDDENEK